MGTEHLAAPPITPPPSSFPYTAFFSVLGGQILVRARHDRCMAGIGEHFSAARSRPWTTPDHVVECDWPEAGRYLFRSRPGGPERMTPLAGVRVHAFPGSATDGPPGNGGEMASEWPFADPPLPAFRLPPFRDRFVGLHAGAVVLPRGGVVIAGERGAGKSTTVLDLVNLHGGALLTDETVFLHRRSVVVEPFACPVGVWENGHRKARIPAVVACSRVSMRPVPIDAVVLLRRDGGRTGVKSVSAEAAFRGMLTHHVDVGCDPDEAMTTLAMLAGRVPTATATWSSYAELRALPTAIVRWFAAER